MKRTYVLLACLILVLLAGSAIAEDGIAINAANFPDTVFRNAVTSFDNSFGNGDGRLSETEIGSFKHLYIDENGEKLTSLKGIELLTSLEGLTIENVVKLSQADFSACKSITTIALYDCKSLREINVSGLSNLKYLVCSTSCLEKLDVSSLVSLEGLWVNNAKLTSLDVRNNPALTKLYCNGNDLESLDVSANPALEELDCKNNKLKDLNIAVNTALKKLYCQNNRLSSLDVSNAPNLVRCLSEGRVARRLSPDSGIWIGYAYNYGEYKIQVDPAVSLMPEPTTEFDPNPNVLLDIPSAAISAEVKVGEAFFITELSTLADIEIEMHNIKSASSSNKSVAKAELVKIVHYTGEDEVDWVEMQVKVTPLKPGKTNIIVKAKSGSTKSFKLALKVVDPNAPETVVIAEGTTAEVPIEGTLQLNASVLPDTARQGITWKTASAKTATVSDTGLVTGVKAGTAVITASADNGKKATIKVTVYDPTIPQSIKINEMPEDGAALEVFMFKPDVQLSVTAEPLETASKEVKWKSAKPKIVKVGADGTLTPVKAGTAKITATSTKNKKAKATITVTVVDLTVPAGIEVTSATGDSKVGIKGMLQLNAAAVAQDPEVTPVETVTWKTKNKKIAKVDKNGLVTGLKKGTVLITATSTKDKKVVGEFTVEVVETTTGEAVEMPDIEPVIEEPVAEAPLDEDPSDEQPAPETDAEWSDWYGEADVTTGDWYEEF